MVLAALYLGAIFKLRETYASYVETLGSPVVAATVLTMLAAIGMALASAAGYFAESWSHFMNRRRLRDLERRHAAAEHDEGMLKEAFHAADEAARRAVLVFAGSWAGDTVFLDRNELAEAVAYVLDGGADEPPPALSEAYPVPKPPPALPPSSTASTPEVVESTGATLGSSSNGVRG